MVSPEELLAVTLERAYPNSGTNSFQPKVPPGTYTCVRGLHQLEHMNAPFQTFEVTGVTGHTGILFHVGNTQNDSIGCILLGSSMHWDGHTELILNSKVAFNRFMALQKDQNSFQLVVAEDLV